MEIDLLILSTEAEQVFGEIKRKILSHNMGGYGYERIRDYEWKLLKKQAIETARNIIEELN
jgi:hypothetical protein